VDKSAKINYLKIQLAKTQKELDGINEKLSACENVG
jgi:hypothetical protein